VEWGALGFRNSLLWATVAVAVAAYPTEVDDMLVLSIRLLCEVREGLGGVTLLPPLLFISLSLSLAVLPDDCMLCRRSLSFAAS